MNKLTKLLSAVQRYAAPLLAAYLTLVLVLTHLPLQPSAEMVPFESDKLEHLIAYSILSLLASIWLHRDQPSIRPARVLAVLGIVLAIGAFDEITQPLPPFYRVCDVGDWIADLLGGLIGAGLYAWARWLGLFGSSIVGRGSAEVAQVD